VAAAATDVTSVASALTGDGQVTISYDPATDGCAGPPPTTTPGPGAPASVIAVVRFTG
jgi:hypothetical protein